VGTFPVTITGAWATGNGAFTPPAAGDLQVWFGCGNTSGYVGWDSAFGANYHFAVTGTADVSVALQTSYDAGYGNALYVTGETDGLGGWQTAYKATPGAGEWTYDARVPVGTQFKWILAPWVTGGSISVSTPGARWERGGNHVVPAGDGGATVVISIDPSF
jgi:hypothetical protein